jgi:hypothetical protein
VSSLEDRQAAPRVYATAGHTDALLDVIRKRIDELDIPYAVVEAVSGCQSGYLAKILANPPPKRMGTFTLFIILEALGLQLAVFTPRHR